MDSVKTAVVVEYGDSFKVRNGSRRLCVFVSLQRTDVPFVRVVIHNYAMNQAEGQIGEAEEAC